MKKADRTVCLYVLNQHFYPQKLFKTLLNCHFWHWFKTQYHTDWKPEFKMLQEENKFWELFFFGLYSAHATFPSATWSINQNKFPNQVCWKNYVFLMKINRNWCWKSVENNDKDAWSCVCQTTWGKWARQLGTSLTSDFFAVLLLVPDAAAGTMEWSRKEKVSWHLRSCFSAYRYFT